ncbi:uncharacterized protein DUF4238 [Desulfitobacterium sp. LBE]|uniref:DUF4238 domain-containing protein n=1 Tax=Desulfitobacterium sp. LBE TaxID=884086 RepID=UPI001199ADEA|nr:DUF4238 domain-containing protein [Desulfitobacterium sp. LBE]TWH59624.1 uncharacterized protein DUF4238 [Desulfitobacterium sp. LBE]
MQTNLIAHNNHYIPQFYLKNWSQDGNSIFVYNLLVSDSRIPHWNRKKIKSTAVWNDFYTRNEGEKEVDDFEKWFDKEFESPVKTVFDNLIKGHNLDEDESKKLSRFVGAQYLRTPARLNALMAQWRTEMPQILEGVLQKISTQFEIESTSQIISSQPQIYEDAKLLPIKVSVDKEMSQVKVDSLVGKGMYLFALKHLLTKTVSVLGKHRWRVIHASDSVSFPTSDDPVICLNYSSEHEYDFKGGWGKKNGNIIMPLSPKLLLITQIGSYMPIKQLDYSERWSKFFRKIIIEHAHRHVYAIEPQKGMLAINPRRVDAILFEREKSIMGGWHGEQMEMEAQLR